MTQRIIVRGLNTDLAIARAEGAATDAEGFATAAAGSAAAADASADAAAESGAGFATVTAVPLAPGADPTTVVTGTAPTRNLEIGIPVGEADDATMTAVAEDTTSDFYAAINKVPNIVFEGDSQSCTGVGSTALSATTYNDTMPAFAIAGVDPQAVLYNVSAIGHTLTQMISQYPTEVAPKYDAAKNNVAVLWGGTNDFGVSGDTAAQVLSDIASWVALARATGFRVITGTMLPRADGSKPVGFDANRATVNTALRANAGGIYGDFIADPAADTRIGDDGDSASTIYYTDSLHMTPTGYAIAAAYFRVGLAALGVKLPSQQRANAAVPSVSAIASGFGIGYKALVLATGGNNTAVGDQALSTVTTGAGNTALGTSALKLNTGDSNVAVGWFASLANTSGTQNVAVGTFAAQSNQTGSQNVAVGHETMKVNTASSNTAVGFQALDANTNGASNVALGKGSLGASVSGSNSVAVGSDALGSGAAVSQTVGVGSFAGRTSTGSDNIHVGYSAGYQAAGNAANATTTGARQVNVGTESGQNSATQRNDTVAVGYRALVDAADTVALGSGAQALHSSAVALGKGSVTTAADQVMVGARDIESTKTAGGIILKSPDGTRYKLTIANGGTTSVAAA